MVAAIACAMIGHPEYSNGASFQVMVSCLRSFVSNSTGSLPMRTPLTRHKRYLNKVAHLEKQIEDLTEELRIERLKNVQRSMTPFDL